MTDHSHDTPENNHKDNHNVPADMTARHTAGWNNFMRYATWGIFGVVIVLLALDFFLVR